MSSRGAGTVLLALLFICSPLRAQDPLASHARVDPASVVTLPIALPGATRVMARESEGIEYEIEPGAGFRLLGEKSGKLDLEPGELAVLPVTLSVGTRVTAGEHVALTARFHSESTTDLVSVLVEVSRIPGLTLRIAPKAEEARIGEDLPVQFTLTNSGNAPDSVELSVDTRLGEVVDLLPAVTLGPFESVSGSFTVRPRQSDLSGSREGILMTAHGETASSHDRTEVSVFDQKGLLDQWASIPTSVFVGTSLYPGSDGRASTPAYAVESAGMLYPGVRVSVRAHSAPEETSVFAFRGYPLGPRFLAELSTSRFRLGVGQLYSKTSALTGYALQGAGGGIEAALGPIALRAQAAVPLDPRGNTVDGEQYLAGGEVRIPAGAFGFEAVSESRGRSDFSPERNLRSALLTYRSPGPSSHQLRIDAGWMQLAYPGSVEAAEGPAVDARYSYSDGASLFELSARARPSVSAERDLPPEELRASGMVPLASDHGLLAEAYVVDRPRTAGLQASRIRGLNWGAFFLDGPDRYEVRFRMQSADGAIPFASRSVEGVASRSIGTGFIDARLEIGESVTSLDRGLLLHFNGGYNLRSNRSWGRAGLLYYRDPLTRGNVSLQVAGSVQPVNRLDVFGSVTTSLSQGDPLRRLSTELGVQAYVTRSLSVLAAYERTEGAYGSSANRYSLGIRQGIPLPVPVRQPNSLQGFVFEDDNGNGRYDSGESPLDGIRLQMGRSNAITRDGRFEFDSDAARGPLTIDPASLGSAYLPPVTLPSFDEPLVQIPVHRPVSLEFSLFQDLDGDRIRDPIELPMPDVAVTIRNSAGESWTVQSGSDGSGVLGSMRPGVFTITIDPESLPGRSVPPEPVTIALRGGESASIDLPVGQREIRFRTSE
ncbi:MAG: hypothetical protein M8841_04725 [marine benthic group bacterium]|jgi:hypothetical protein|nr:hypothetical protein [Gemmatimonadota bacterium]MCL7970628.1 hypothetical protein [Candidatus Benthicola marisminoris]MCL7938415.1 hypothetical protein [Gemmatimonadota bacterium]MCL7966425.1 hypothetical protein [Gemmatimonadota bacterium]MCL7969516.1 hypothetical protein [Gemmatimonadota bacterium]